MALIDKVGNKGDQPVKVDSSNNLVELNLRETEILLTLIKSSQFKGEDIEPLYNLVLKLQHLYLTYKK
jgi:hypothetical protein